MLHELSLFTGYGGMTLGLRLVGLEVRTVAYVEIDPYCQAIIQQRIRDGMLDDAPIWPDICAFDGGQCRGVVDIITAGFPCQPHSTAAGAPKGGADPRNLWPETCRIIREVQPGWVLLENVEAITFSNAGADPFVLNVEGDLASIGYDGSWDCVPATSVGAPHGRWRWWRLAYSSSLRGAPQQERQHHAVERAQQPRSDGKGGLVARWDWAEWPPETRVCRVDDGASNWLERHRALGNGVVPAVVAKFLKV